MNTVGSFLRLFVIRKIFWVSEKTSDFENRWRDTPRFIKLQEALQEPKQLTIISEIFKFPNYAIQKYNI